MFLSYEYLGYLGHDPKTNEYLWEYKIVDSEFGEGVGVGVGVAVIQEYSKRNLTVAPNLVRAMQLVSKKYGYSIQQIIDWNKQYNPLYKQYQEEVDKYLTLL
jgi:hypothetical protein